ncbi:MAG: DNA repair protein RecN [Hyphomicrobiales bacterium]|nr:DNA repair protein RecN [Hyphomicrobiales bacterium]
MLAQLLIRDIVLIDRLELAFAGGLSVLTGETGAGKSILLDAFALALGGRGDGSLVRHGEAQGQVTAVFDLAMDHPARALARSHDLDVDGELILRRVQVADGRTRAFINDQPVSVQALRTVGAALVEIHGQHDDRALIEPETHRALLDVFGDLGEQAAVVSTAWRTWREARTALDQQRSRVEAARKEADFLRHAADELGKLGAQAGEEAELARQRQLMMQAEKVAKDIADASEALSGQGSPIPDLSAHMRRLERRAAQAPELVEAPVKALEAALVALDEAATTLEAALRATEFDPHELERCEERLFALRAAARKYDVPADGLAGLQDRFVAELAALDAGEQHLKGLEADLALRAAAYAELATGLSAARVATAKQLDAAVTLELPPLKLERASFITQVTTDPGNWSATGNDHVEFWVQTNPGTRPGPMFKVASGGELSRFMLALKVVLADKGSAPTLVFDEIDTGVGGAVADAIGQRLARLAARVQVVSVTHAPQVAAKAGQHFLISKQAVGADRVATRVAPLADGERGEELARMLAGATITDEARAAAKRLLDMALEH